MWVSLLPMQAACEPSLGAALVYSAAQTLRKLGVGCRELRDLPLCRLLRQ